MWNRSIVYRALVLGLSLGLLALASFYYHSNFLAYHFGDEQDNFVLGKFVTQGKSLYGDLFSHHQPLAYVISASVQTAASPDSIYLLISRHRLFVVVWAGVWLLLLGRKLGWGAPIFVLGYEFGKAFIFGNLFLSESLVAYPVVFLALLLLDKRALTKWESFVSGVAIGTALLLLSPLWPAVIAMAALLLWQKNINRHTLLFSLAGLAGPFIICLPFVSVKDYLFNTFYINSQYFIPWSSAHGDMISPLAFLTPVMPFLTPGWGNFLIIMRIWSALYLLVAALSFKTRKVIVVASFLILGLANLRYVVPGSEIYTGFHLIPYFALLVGFTALFGRLLLEEKKRPRLLRVSLVGGMIASALATVFIARGVIFTPVNQTDSFFINYSETYDIGEVIRVTKKPGDTLLSVPGNHWLVYWQADISNASVMVNYFPWMQMAPPLRAKVDALFAQKKTYPTYFYCDCEESYLSRYLGDYTSFTKAGKSTNLYVLKEKALEITDNQREEIKRLNYSL